MKKTKLFALAFAALALGACSSDDVVEQKSQAQWTPEGQGYINLAINLPTQAGSRANDNFDDGTIEEYVKRNHDAQKATLDAYDISLSIYEGSGLGHAGTVHQAVSERFIKALYDAGVLHRRSTLQFFDTQANTFLNGRQVVGRCPVQGCKSEHAYADECDLGHSYAPEDLIAPKSTLTGTVPEMRPVENWYFDLPAFSEFLRGYVADLREDKEMRAIVPQVIEEFLAPPIMYVKNELTRAVRRHRRQAARAHAARGREGQAELRGRVRHDRRPRCRALGD